VAEQAPAYLAQRRASSVLVVNFSFASSPARVALVLHAPLPAGVQVLQVALSSDRRGFQELSPACALSADGTDVGIAADALSAGAAEAPAAAAATTRDPVIATQTREHSNT